jgi:hypothetical protein
LINFLKKPANQLQFIAVELAHSTASSNSVKGLSKPPQTPNHLTQKPLPGKKLRILTNNQNNVNGKFAFL